jgi:DNA modification methylase
MSEYAEDRLTILHGDAAALDLPDASVDLIVTSPPYFGLRSYQDGGEHYARQVGDEATPGEFVAALLRCTREWVRVLKPTGSIWVNLGDKYSRGSRPKAQPDQFRDGADITYLDPKYLKDMTPESTGIPGKSLLGIPWRYALACIDDLGLILRAEVIWSKPNGLPESVTDRVRRSHEQWFHFTVAPRYFSNVDDVREDYTAPPFKGQKVHTATSEGQTTNPSIGTWDASDYEHNPLGKLPGSVWTIPTQPLRVPEHLGINHFAAFPMEWPRRIIRGWSPEGGVVLDPFGGTGTTALVAWALGRHGISNDLSHDYCRLAQWRTTDPGERARALLVDKPPA